MTRQSNSIVELAKIHILVYKVIIGDTILSLTLNMNGFNATLLIDIVLMETNLDNNIVNVGYVSNEVGKYHRNSFYKLSEYRIPILDM